MNKYLDLRKIVIKYHGDDSTKEYLVSLSDVNKMITALIKLHIYPGVNPHNGGKTAPIELITLITPKLGNYWWTSTTLNNDPDQSATLLEFVNDKSIFMSRDVMIKMKLQSFHEYVAMDEGETGEPFDNEYIESEIMKIKTNTKAYIDSEYKNLVPHLDTE